MEDHRLDLELVGETSAAMPISAKVSRIDHPRIRESNNRRRNLSEERDEFIAATGYKGVYSTS